MNRYKYWFTLSIAFNLIALAYIVKHYYFEFFQNQPETSTGITYAFNRQTVFELFKVNENDIVFAGDSHTQRFDTQEYLPGYNIINRGIDFDSSAGLLNRLNQIIPGHPSKIFIEIGFNDLIAGISPDSVAKNVDAIIFRIQKESPKTKIFLNNIFATTLEMPEVNLKSAIAIFNQKLAYIATHRKITLVDIHSALSNNGKLNEQFDCGDAIHLNGQGYLMWSKMLKPYL